MTTTASLSPDRPTPPDRLKLPRSYPGSHLLPKQKTDFLLPIDHQARTQSTKLNRAKPIRIVVDSGSDLIFSRPPTRSTSARRRDAPYCVADVVGNQQR